MSKPLLVAKDIGKLYLMGRAKLRVLEKCNLSVDRGEFIAIMGKSGSGKSTLLHVLGALDVPQEGQVFFDDQPVFSTNIRARSDRTSAFDVFSPGERRRIELRRRSFGFVFQFYHLLPELSVLENVLLTRMVGTSTFAWFGVRAGAEREARETLTRVGLGERLKHRPNELSGGERQRVAIARALIHKPNILFADEPTGNLDASSGGVLMKLLHELNREGQTIVLVTHDPGVAAQAHRTLQLDAGRLVG